MILLADADILIYQAASKNQQSYKWDTETTSIHVEELETAIATLDNDISNLMKVTKTKEVLMALSSSPNFRYDVLPSYKHNRKGVDKPVLLQQLRDYLLATYPYKVMPTLEGDDILGIMMTKYPGKYLCATIDKDLKQIPGKHYNWYGSGKFFEVTEELGDWWFYRQVLTGDPGDGYCGCPGIGAKKAEAILSIKTDPKIIWKDIVSTYESKGLTEADALQQARVARICRVSEWNFEEHKVRLWTP